ncbi:MAG TPA: AMP-binding protein [Thermoanaerobaculia bacterium]
MDERPSAILAQPAAAGRASGLPGMVFARAGETPEEPALFYPEGMDVRWRSWGVLAAQAAAGAEALAALGLPPGARVAFRWRPEPDAVAADLAIQAAGLVAVPSVAPGAAAVGGAAVPEPPAPEARLLAPDEPEPEDGPPAARLPAASGEVGGGRASAPPALPGTAGGAWIVDVASGPGAGTGRGAVVGAADLLARVRDLEEHLARAASGAAAVMAGARRAPGTGGREIAAASFDLRYADGRTFLAWALATGAALFLEPDPHVLPGSVAWARPTLVAGEARILAELGRRVRALEGKRPRLRRRRSRSALPFERLHLLLVLGTGRLPVDDVAFWAGRGVAVARASG